VKRRQVLMAAALAGGMAHGLPSLAAAPRQRRVGHTGITWGYGADKAPQAIADAGKLGYQGFESFGSVLEHWDARGGLQAALHKARLPLIGAYLPLVLTDPLKRAEELDRALRWGELIKQYGGTVAVIGPDNVDRRKFVFADAERAIVTALTYIGSALHDIGITAALHQHTGSCVMTRDELYSVMDKVGADQLKLCPDTGELLAAGVDPLQTVKDLLPRIAHVHLKDYDNGGDHDGYCPVGTGRVDMPAILDVLETATQPFMLMAELNPASETALTHDKRSAGELAGISRQHLAAWGYRFG